VAGATSLPAALWLLVGVGLLVAALASPALASPALASPALARSAVVRRSGVERTFDRPVPYGHGSATGAAGPRGHGDR
jgi:hypothetical protein